jgi:serine/threonine-protein kinase
MPMTGERKPFPVVTGPFAKNEPQFSHDGKWLAFSTNESTAWEVYIVSFPDLKQREKASVGGGFQPRWSPDGNTLYYRAPGGDVKAVAVRKTPKLEVAPPVQMFNRNFQPGYTNSQTRHQWNVSPDGERFLLRSQHQAMPTGGSVATVTMTYSVAGAGSASATVVTNPPWAGLTVLLNWPSALRKGSQ